VCRELTKLHETVERGTATELAGRLTEPPRGEITLVLAAAGATPPAMPDDAALAELAGALGAKRAAALAASLSGASRNAIYARLTRRGGD